VATSGAKPLAVTDCLNFGSPEDPEVMWQFAESVRGLSDACMELGVPVTGGNVSLYNQTGGVPIHPTPVVGVLGVFDDVARRTPSGWEEDGQAIYLLGTTAAELDGSEWANLRGHLGGRPPKADLSVERRLAEILVNASRDGMVDAAHDLSEGGLAAALVESSLRFNTGARIGPDEVCERDGVDVFTLLFSESQGRAIVAVPRSEEIRFTDMCSARHFPAARIGVVDAASGSLDVQGHFSLTLDELRTAHEGTLVKYFG
jgi:phosphoribosylformylglycinamidine synthase